MKPSTIKLVVLIDLAVLVSISAIFGSRKSEKPTMTTQQLAAAKQGERAKEQERFLLADENIIQYTHLACYDWADYDLFDKLWHTSGAETFASAMIASDRCENLPIGMKVALEETGPGNRQCILLPGKPYCAWTRVSLGQGQQEIGPPARRAVGPSPAICRSNRQSNSSWCSTSRRPRHTRP